MNCSESGSLYRGPECQKREWRLHKEQCKTAAEVIASMNGESIGDLDARSASFRRDTEAGDAAAQCNLGVCYVNGSGGGVDKTEAVEWFKRAAEVGHADAQFNLGVCYDNRDGC